MAFSNAEHPTTKIQLDRFVTIVTLFSRFGCPPEVCNIPRQEISCLRNLEATCGRVFIGDQGLIVARD